MTFGDFIMEASMYEHSDEYFQLSKDCMELSLTEQYIDNQIARQNYLAENGKEGCFSEGYFTEEVSEDTMKELFEKVETKKQNIFNRIWTGIKKLVSRFANWLLKFSEGIKKNQEFKTYEELKAALSENEEKAKELDAKLKAAEEKNGVLVNVIRKKHDRINELNKKVNIESAISDCRALALQSATEKNEKLEVELTKAKGSYAIDPVVLGNILNKFVNSGLASDDSKQMLATIKSVSKELDDAIQETRRTNTISIPQNTRQLQTVVEQLNKIGSNVMDGLSELAGATKKEKDALNKEFEGGAEVLSASNLLLNKVSKVVADTMSAMNGTINVIQLNSTESRNLIKSLKAVNGSN